MSRAPSTLRWPRCRAPAHASSRQPVPPLDAHASLLSSAAASPAPKRMSCTARTWTGCISTTRASANASRSARTSAPPITSSSLRLRASAIEAFSRAAAPFDAVVMPTVACIAPTIEEAGRSDDDYVRWNLRLLRNAGVVNFLDGCALTLPCHEPGSAPVGFMRLRPGRHRSPRAGGRRGHRACPRAALTTRRSLHSIDLPRRHS